MEDCEVFFDKEIDEDFRNLYRKIKKLDIKLFFVKNLLWITTHPGIWEAIVIFLGASGTLLLAYSVAPDNNVSFDGTPAAGVIQSKFDLGIGVIILGYFLQFVSIVLRKENVKQWLIEIKKNRLEG